MPKKHNSGMRGVYLAAAELSMNPNLVVTVTARNGVGADILAYNKESRRFFAVQVKTNTHGSKSTLRSFWLIGKSLQDTEPREDFVWILIADHAVEHDDAPEFWVVPDAVMIERSPRPNMKGLPSISRSKVEEYIDKWEIFGEGRYRSHEQTGPLAR